VWRTLLIAAMGEALDDDERAIFKQFTGRAAQAGADPIAAQRTISAIILNVFVIACRGRCLSALIAQSR
jgi:hypothetical protein